MWNLVHLPCPAQDICEYPPQERSAVEQFHDLISILSAGADLLTSDHPIWTEIKVFRNVQAKYKRILHCDKCLQLLQRVGRCLRKMILLNLSRSYLDLAERFIIALQDPNAALFLPSRQQMEYILIRTQGTVKLICEALQYSKETFCYLVQKLRVGHMLLDLVMATSVTARLNIMFKGILKQLCSLYKKLHTWIFKLKKGTWKWPSPLDLPKDIKKWLGPQYFESLSLATNGRLDFLANVFQKEKEKDESDTDSVVEVPKDDDEDDCVEVNNNTEAEVDHGEVIPRKTTEKLPQQLTSSQKTLIFKIFKAKTLKKLLSFWDNINIYSEDLRPRVLTEKKIECVNKLFKRLKSEKANKPSSKKGKRTPLTHIEGFRFAKCLGLIKTREEYSRVVKSFLEETDELNTNLKPVRKIKELRQMHKEMCEKLSEVGEEEKSERLTRYFKEQHRAVKNLKKNGEKALAKKLIYYTSKVLITMYQA